MHAPPEVLRTIESVSFLHKPVSSEFLLQVCLIKLGAIDHPLLSVLWQVNYAGSLKLQ